MKKILLLTSLFILTFSVSGCGNSSNTELPEYIQNVGGDDTAANGYENMNGKSDIITLDDNVTNLEKGLSAVKYEGDYGFDEFLKQGGAESDSDVVAFLSENVLSSGGLSFGKFPFGCSTVSVKDPDGNFIFGRNFDWDSCNAMIVQSVPENGYSSISTVNTDFINMSGLKLSELPDKAQAVICLYAPLDGMNEMGLAVSVNMIQDSAAISQNSDKPDITTTI